MRPAARPTLPSAAALLSAFAALAGHALVVWAIGGGSATVPVRGPVHSAAVMTLVRVGPLPTPPASHPAAPRAAVDGALSHLNTARTPVRSVAPTESAERMPVGYAPRAMARDVVAQSAESAEMSTLPQAWPEAADTAEGALRWRDYLPSQRLERAAVPRSTPDESMLEGLPLSGLPLRLRLFIDRAGSVVDTAVLQASEDDEVMQAVRRMFLATTFIAGRLHGEDVATFIDVELTAGDAR